MKEVIDTVSVALASGEVEELGGAVMQEVNRSLLSAGVNEEWADKIDNLIVPECPAGAICNERAVYRLHSFSA